MKIVLIKERQSIFDVAIRTSGSIEAAYEMALTKGINITDVLASGTELPLVTLGNSDVTNSYLLNKYEPATAITPNQYNNTIRCEGIEFWAVEIDFVVS